MKNKIKDPPWVMLPVALLSSAAYTALNVHEHRCLSRFMLESGRHAGRDNGRLPVTYKDLLEYGVHTRHIAPSLRVLEALCLIVCTERGRGANAEYRHPSLYRITFLRSLTTPSNGSGRSEWIPATNEWKKIESPEQASALAAPHRVHEKRKHRPPPQPRKPRNPEDQHDGQHGRTGTPV
jgi:hypothetical protein